MVERSLSSLPRFLSGSLLGGTNKQSLPDRETPCTGVSRGFEIFIQNVNKSTSKHYERQVVERELGTVRQKLSQAGSTTGQACDYLCRAVYCHMLGYDVKFAYIHAVTLAQRGATLLEKRLGYLATSLLLAPDDELILLLINTIQRDLRSTNLLDNCLALTAASQLVGADMVPSLLPLVLAKLEHQRELVRQKAVLCLHKFQTLAPDLLQHVRTELDTPLMDKDPGVVAATLNIVQYNIQRCPESCLPVVDSLISILHQIISRQMPTMFEYHSVPFPWLQIQILQCLGDLGAAHKQLGTKLSPLLLEVLQRASAKENVAYAILYECVRCITRVDGADRALLEEAADHVGRFVRSAEPNYRYIGLKALTALVEVDSQFAVDYQNLIVESLDNTDLTLQRKMYILLYKIANSSNVEAICTRLLLQLETSLDKYWRSEVVTMVLDLAHRLSKTRQWKYETIFQCVQQAGDCVETATVHRVIHGLRHDIGEDDSAVKQFLVKTSIQYLMRDDTTHRLLHIVAWCLGELATLLQNVQNDRVASLYVKRLSDPGVPCEVKACLVSALQKLLCNGIVAHQSLAQLLHGCVESEDHPVIKQRLRLLYSLAIANVQVKLPSPAVQLDFTLSFLDSYISERLENGALPYRPQHLRHLPPVCDASVGETAVYDVQPRDDSEVMSTMSGSRFRSGSSTSSGRPRDDSESLLNLSGVRRVWGREGRLKTVETPPMSSAEGRPNSDVNRTRTDVITDKDGTDIQVMTEEGKRKRELATALFAGVQRSPQVRRDSDTHSSRSGHSNRSGQSGHSGGGHSDASDGHSNRSGQSGPSSGHSDSSDGHSNQPGQSGQSSGRSDSSDGHRSHFDTSDSNGDTALPASDGGGWRSLHQQHQRPYLPPEGVENSPTDVRETRETSPHYTDEQPTKTGDIASIYSTSHSCKTVEQCAECKGNSTLSVGDSSIETYLTCNSSAYLKSPVVSPIPVNKPVNIYGESVDIIPAINENFKDELSSYHLEVSISDSLKGELGNEVRAREFNTKADPFLESGEKSDIDSVKYLSFSDKSSLQSIQGNNSEHLQGDNSTYVNISLCSNDSAKVNLSEVCVNNNYRTRQTEMVLPRVQTTPNPNNVTGSDISPYHKGDKQVGARGELQDNHIQTCTVEVDHDAAEFGRAIGDRTQPGISVPNIYDEEPNIYDKEPNIYNKEPNIYDEELDECEKNFHHSSPIATENMDSGSQLAGSEGDPCIDCEGNLPPFSLFSDDPSKCSNNEPVTSCVCIGKHAPQVEYICDAS